MRSFVFTAAALLAAGTLLAADHEVVHPFQSVVPAGEIRRVVVDIPAADVTVRTIPAAELRVSGTVRRNYSGAPDRVDQQKIADDSSMDIYAGKTEAFVRRRFGPAADGWRAQNHNASWDVTLEVPAGMTVWVRAKAGDVTLDGSFGDVDVDLRAGDIKARLPRESVRELDASCRVGSVTTNTPKESVEKQGLFPGHGIFYNATGRGSVRLHTTAGDVNVTVVGEP